MGAFADLLGLTQHRGFEGSILDMVVPQDVVQKLVDHLRDKGIGLGQGLYIGSGGFSVVLQTVRAKDNEPVPGAVTRIEEFGNRLQHPLCLQPAFQEDFVVGDQALHAYVLPSAPDLDFVPVMPEDVLRSLRVLKATGNEKAMLEIKPDNFAFLRGLNGKLICYPNTVSDADFRGKPIAFVRDLGSCVADKEFQDGSAGMKKKDHTYAGKDLYLLDAAPMECVEACKQQYAITRKLAHTLCDNGIVPNVPVPDGGPALLGRLRTQSITTASERVPALHTR